MNDQGQKLFHEKGLYRRGIYRHYKNKKTYRLLFVAAWRSGTCSDLRESEGLYARVHHTSISCDVAVVRSIGLLESCLLLFTAKWSGNGSTVKDGERLAVYVGLYDEGRVSVRPLDEFEATVDLYADGDSVVTGPRFERVGD